MEKEIYLLGVLCLLVFTIDYPILDSFLISYFDEKVSGKAERIVDGDTIVVNGTTIRLLGINTPEKNEAGYLEAKEFLEKNILNKSVRLEGNYLDKYYRQLSYVYLEGKNINLEIVKKGFANFYFPTKDRKYFSEFYSAWETCLESQENLCEKSEDICGNCVKIKEISFSPEKIILENSCLFSCDLSSWTIKDEGRKKFIFPKAEIEKELTIFIGKNSSEKNSISWNGEDYVLTKTGDSLILRDSKNKLVDFRYFEAQ
jgi:hypothetical protein